MYLYKNNTLVYQVVPVIDSYLTPSIETPPSGEYLGPGSVGNNNPGFSNSGHNNGGSSSSDPATDNYSGPLPSEGFNFVEQPIGDNYGGPNGDGDNFADYSNQVMNINNL